MVKIEPKTIKIITAAEEEIMEKLVKSKFPLKIIFKIGSRFVV